MFKEIKLTIYDFLGYLLPGVPFLFTIIVLYWVLFFTREPLPLPSLTSTTWVLFLFLAYLFGHVVQAIGNLISKGIGLTEGKVLSKSKNPILPEAVVKAARSAVSKTLAVDSKHIENEDLYALCDTIVLQFGQTAEREILQYREGFYRGFSISMTFLALALIVRAFVPGSMVSISGKPYHLIALLLAFMIVVLLLSALFCFLRYKRFFRFRIKSAIFACLVLQDKLREKGR
jgi:hypothetical protein